jgi:hypothetical protein
MYHNKNRGRSVTVSKDSQSLNSDDHLPISAVGKNTYLRMLLVFIFCVFLSFLFLLLATKSSPLYPFNDWVDANAAFTMGKGMMNGRVLYRDLFEQRGPYFYLIYGVAYLVSRTTFLGVFVLEVISFSIFLFFSYKLVQLFIDQKYALITLPLLAGSVLNLTSFAHGGSPEQLSLPLLMISLYYLIKYFKKVYPDSMPNQWIFINGIIAGCVLWIKFSFLGFWIGWAASLLIGMLIKKQISQAIKLSLIFLLGMITATLPWIIYFGIHNAIYDWIYTYILFNFTIYPKSISLGQKLTFLAMNLIFHLGSNPISFGLMIVGLYSFVKNKKYLEYLVNRFGLFSCFFLLILSVYGGGRGFIYYFLIFSPFIVLGFIVLICCLYEKFGEIKSNKFFVTIILLSVVGIFYFTSQLNQNTYMRQFDKEDLVQYKFAAIITQTEDATLMNYGWLDGGFYTVTGIVPNIRFFQGLQNLSYSQFQLGVDEQNRYIKEQLVDYVVVRVPVMSFDDINEIPFLNKNYVLVAKEMQEFENNEYYYYLYKKSN